jgi:hypothetical protein
MLINEKLNLILFYNIPHLHIGDSTSSICQTKPELNGKSFGITQEIVEPINKNPETPK